MFRTSRRHAPHRIAAPGTHFTSPAGPGRQLAARRRLGDLDGPGLSAATLAVGAGSADGLGLDRGAVFLLFLTAAGKVLYHEELSSTAGNISGLLDDGDEFGSALASLGDLDGAGGGAVTLATGVSFDDDVGLDRGATYLLSLSGGTPVGVGDDRSGPLSEGLGCPRPNLFTHQTTIPFRLNERARVRIEVWDAGGRRVRRLVDGETGPGATRPRGMVGMIRAAASRPGPTSSACRSMAAWSPIGQGGALR
jgi:hypothetical protein